jgi:hypothetical protein
MALPSTMGEFAVMPGSRNVIFLKWRRREQAGGERCSSRAGLPSVQLGEQQLRHMNRRWRGQPQHGSPFDDGGGTALAPGIDINVATFARRRTVRRS